MTDFAGLMVGVDIGGTKTQLRASEASDGHDDLVLPTAEWRVRDWDKDADTLHALVRKLVGDKPVAALAVGAHGCDDAQECEAFETALSRHASFPVRVVNDAELLPAALGYKQAIGLVAGTGSIAVYRDAEHGMLVAGGWGWIIGDEGSAAGLVREAARAVRLHVDGGGSKRDPLVHHLFETLGIRSGTRVGSALAKLGDAAGLGRHAPLVFEAERQGSALAAQVIRDGARQLVELVAQLKKRGAKAEKIVAGGGVIVAQPSLANAFLEEVALRFGQSMTATIYSAPPVVGALRLAADLSADRRAAPAQPVASAPK